MLVRVALWSTIAIAYSGVMVRIRVHLRDEEMNVAVCTGLP